MGVECTQFCYIPCLEVTGPCCIILTPILDVSILAGGVCCCGMVGYASNYYFGICNATGERTGYEIHQEALREHRMERDDEQRRQDDSRRQLLWQHEREQAERDLQDAEMRAHVKEQQAAAAAAEAKRLEAEARRQAANVRKQRARTAMDQQALLSPIEDVSGYPQYWAPMNQHVLSRQKYTLEPVMDQAVRRALQDCIRAEDERQLGRGRDVHHHGNYNAFELIGAWHVQNPAKWGMFAAGRDHVRADIDRIEQRGSVPELNLK